MWNSFTMMHYAKFGNQTYPFITQYDNAYAIQTNTKLGPRELIK